jgi:hypothetical protein
MFSLLFFDDAYLHQRTNLSRRIGRPTPVPDGTLEDPYVDPAWGYPTVFRDPVTGRWRCLYQGESVQGTFVPVVAESDDGVRWMFPDLSDQVHIPDRLCPHQVLSLSRFLEWSGPYVDSQAVGTDAWLKGFVIHRGKGMVDLDSPLVISPDGLDWRYVEGVRWHPAGADPLAYAFWNPQRQSHVLTARPVENDRRIAVYETRDWRTFSTPELALQADALDTPCAEIYGLPVIPYEAVFIGLLWLYHTDPAVDAANKYLMGKIDCQLAYSYNGWHFQRTSREPFMPNAAPGQYGAGCIYPSSVVPDGNVLRIYSSAAIGEHAQIRGGPASRQGAILLHTLRRDGFVYLEPDAGTGELVTRLLLWAGGEPELNVQVPSGEVRLQITTVDGAPLEGYCFEDCQPFQGDAIGWVPEWRDGRKIAALTGRIIRIRVRLTNGRLFALRGSFALKTAHEAGLYPAGGVQ